MFDFDEVIAFAVVIMFVVGVIFMIAVSLLGIGDSRYQESYEECMKVESCHMTVAELRHYKRLVDD